MRAADLRVLVPFEHWVYRLTKLCAARFVDAAGVNLCLVNALRPGLSAHLNYLGSAAACRLVIFRSVLRLSCDIWRMS